MNKSTKIVVGLLLFFHCIEARADIISSTFDAGADNWTVSRNGASTTPDYSPSAGNPGGAISDIDALSGQAWFFNAPAKFIGNQSRHFNHSFSFDIRQERLSSGSQFGANDILLEGNGLQLRLDIGNDGATGNPPIGQWTNYQFFLNESAGWTHAVTNASASNADLQNVLGAVDVFAIRGEYLSGSVGGDQAFLDNVFLGQAVAVPEPSSVTFLAIICVLATQARYRRTS